MNEQENDQFQRQVVEFMDIVNNTFIVMMQTIEHLAARIILVEQKVDVDE